MKNLLFLAFALFILLPVKASADDAHRRQLAERFLTVNKVKDQVEMMYDKVEGIVFQRIEGLDIPQERDKNLEAMKKIAHDMMYGSLSWDALKKEYIGLYAETFTEEELQQVIDFSESPLGQKMADVSPQLAQRSLEIGRHHAEAVMPQVQDAIQSYMDGLNKPADEAPEEKKTEKTKTK